jgi:hypothetical protein
MHFQTDYIVAFILMGFFAWFIIYLYFNGKKNQKLEEEMKKKKEEKK